MALKFLPHAVALTATLALGPTASATELVQDPGFELGTSGVSPWLQSSSTFGTPLCTVADCGTGGGTGAHSGSWWAWFGGVSGAEEGLVSQPMAFALGAAQLRFFFENLVSGSSADFIQARVDDTPVWTYNAGGAYSGVLGYTQIEVNLDAYADGGIHTLSFYSVSGASGTSNFFVDDVSVLSLPVPEPGSLALMLLGLSGLGLAARARRR